MKIKMYDREEAKKIREGIMNMVADGEKRISSKIDDTMVYWNADTIVANKRIIQARKTKEGWFLYMPKPDIVEHITRPEMPISREDFEFINYLSSVLVDASKEMMRPRYRQVEIKKKVRGKNTYEIGYFHCWSQNRIVKDDGSIVNDLLAVVEYPDGHIERNKFDKVRFIDCEINETKFE